MENEIGNVHDFRSQRCNFHGSATRCSLLPSCCGGLPALWASDSSCLPQEWGLKKNQKF